jgi:hypothetical protein
VDAHAEAGTSGKPFSSKLTNRVLIVSKFNISWLSQSQLTSLEKHGAFSKTLNANFMVLFAIFAHSRHSR